MYSRKVSNSQRELIVRAGEAVKDWNAVSVWKKFLAQGSGAQPMTVERARQCLPAKYVREYEHMPSPPSQ